jgi:hypothetical protein
VFWTRLGSPTEKYQSGSVEEITKLRGRGAPVMVYFSDEPVRPSAVNLEQMKSLAAFRDDLRKHALLETFDDAERLKTKVMGHLTSLLDEVVRKTAVAIPSPEQSVEIVTAQRPDIRVEVKAAFITPEPADRRLRVLLTVEVQNHSPQDFFFGSLWFETSDGQVMQPMRDGVSGEWITSKAVRSGDSISYRFSAEVMLQAAAKNGIDIRCALVKDKINREYRSSADEKKLRVEQARAMGGRVTAPRTAELRPGGITRLLGPAALFAVESRRLTLCSALGGAALRADARKIFFDGSHLAVPSGDGLAGRGLNSDHVAGLASGPLRELGTVLRGAAALAAIFLARSWTTH